MGRGRGRTGVLDWQALPPASVPPRGAETAQGHSLALFLHSGLPGKLRPRPAQAGLEPTVIQLPPQTVCTLTSLKDPETPWPEVGLVEALTAGPSGGLETSGRTREQAGRGRSGIHCAGCRLILYFSKTQSPPPVPVHPQTSHPWKASQWASQPRTRTGSTWQPCTFCGMRNGGREW
jgi:hypothetical protein